MKTIKQLLEELTPEQKKTVNSWGTTKTAAKISNHVFPEGKQRMEIPMKSAPTKSDEKVAPDQEVEEHLNKHGYRVHDYVRGYAKDKHGREISIGKVLGRTGASEALQKKFINDDNRTGSSVKDAKVIISHHPHDVAGMSTGRGWTSCVNMVCKPGAQNYSEHLKDDIHHGTHVAYLVHKDDDDIKNPIARVALKPFTNENGHTILKPEANVYGLSTRNSKNDMASHQITNQAAKDLHHTVSSWAEKNFKPDDKSIYKKHEDVYNDDGHNHAFADNKETVEHIAKHGDKDAKLALLTQDHSHKEHAMNILKGDDDEHIVADVATHTNNPVHLKELASHSAPRVRAAVAKRGISELNDNLVDDPSPFIRAAVATHGNPAHLDKLVHDRSKSVRFNVAKHGNMDHASQLMYDDDDDVSDAAHARFTELNKHQSEE